MTPYISKVWSYRPAPGQFINVLPEYLPSEAESIVLKRAEEALVGKAGKGMVCLGAWGGSIVVGFDHTIENKPDTFDFRVWGNAYPMNSEPGIVMVSKDANGNGLPDDEWYELAGSEYHSDDTWHDYCCTYYRPSPTDGDVFWRDNKGDSGYVRRNSYHTQASYYPLWVKEDSLVIRGSRLVSNFILHNGIYQSPGFEWGYADNRPNTSEQSAFDIGWAVDSLGRPVHLDGIDFVKVYTAQQQDLGWIGETSTELCGIEDLHFRLPPITLPVLEWLSDGRLYLETPTACRLCIFDLQGGLVYTKTLQAGSREQLDIRFLPEKMYLVHLPGTKSLKCLLN